MFGRGLTPTVSSSLEMNHSRGLEKQPWPRRFLHDATYLFFPFVFVAFLILLTGTLLITWGHLSNGVLVGFCVTASLLIGFYLLCHLLLYCGTWTAKAKTGSDRGSATSFLEAGRRHATHDNVSRPATNGGIMCADYRSRRPEQEGESSRRNGARDLDHENGQRVCRQGRYWSSTSRDQKC